jgi:alcohol dehydrogenase class IV
MSNAMLLPAVTEFSVPGAVERYAECARVMGMVRPGTPANEAATGLIQNLHELNKKLEVPTPGAFGIDRQAWDESIPTMVQQALASGSPANNPRVPSPQEIERLYHEIWSG